MKKPYIFLKDSPPFWPDNSIYFLTESCFLHFPYFSRDEQKQIVLNQIKKLNEKLSIPVSDYSVAKNHYHIKFYLKSGLLLSKVKQLLRGGISYEYQKRFKMPYKEMWQTRKTIVINSEKVNWRVSGYIVGNLLKHREVGRFEDLRKNDFSSYWYLAKKYGEEEIQDLVRRVLAADEDKWGGIDLDGLSKIDI
ncbi:MAG: hypothetical protein KAJ48_04355 [Elusimicrobiales bacterium]|nr:hypothetical protein [Elusimicrobiales bacterium]